jgi:replicative DNA helicase
MGLKAMSKELECPVVVLAQLNRGSERDRNRRPRISDLRESGQIEADADNIGLLWRPDEEGEESTPAGGDDQRVNLTWAKCRNGRTGEVPMVLRRRFTRFYPVDENPSHTP